MIRAALLALGAAAATACVSPASVFTCETSDQCTTGGTCQPTGFCSFADATCPDGQRYGEAAGGGFAGQCVGDMFDAPPGTIDSPPGTIDAGIDADPCMAPFVRTANGCHAFLTPMLATFDDGRTICQGMGADLPVVQTVEESTYIAASAGLTASDRALIGLDFRSGTWTWIDGTGLSFTNWEVGEPSAGDNIAVIRPTPTGTWAGRLATQPWFVVCEK